MSKSHRAMRVGAVAVILAGAGMLFSPGQAAASEIFCTGNEVYTCPGDGEAWCNLTHPNCHYVDCYPWGGGSNPAGYFVECAPGF